jgi:hypothetical protein
MCTSVELCWFGNMCDRCGEGNEGKRFACHVTADRNSRGVFVRKGAIIVKLGGEWMLGGKTEIDEGSCEDRG